MEDTVCSRDNSPWEHLTLHRWKAQELVAGTPSGWEARCHLANCGCC